MGIRRLIVGLGAVGASLVIGTSAAWACTNLATMNLSNAAGVPGSNITVTGSSFKAATATAPGAPVALHWNSTTGPVLATAIPDATGNISAAVTIPQASPGYYVVIATQTINGADAYGTPARAAYQVINPGQRPAVTPNAGQSAGAATSSPSSTGVVALTVALGVAGLALFGAGATSFARQARRRSAPAAQKAKK